MDEQNFDHILNYSNILKDFNISKKITLNEINNIRNMINKVCDDDSKKQELFKKEILKNTNSYLKNHNIPGIIIRNSDNTFSWVTRKQDNNQNNTDKDDSSQNITKLPSLKSKKYKNIKNDVVKLSDYLLNNKKLTKHQLAFFIISLIEILELTDTDFERFYDETKNGNLENEYDEDDNDNDDEEEQEL